MFMIYTQDYLENLADLNHYSEDYNLQIIVDDLIKQNISNNTDKNLIHTGGENDEFWL